MGDAAWDAAAAAGWNCRLTTIGRTSGLPRTVTLWFVPDGDRLLLAGGAEGPHWCRNVGREPRVEVSLGGLHRGGRARLVEDPAESAAIRERFVRRYLLARLSRAFGGYTRSRAVVVELDPRPGTAGIPRPPRPATDA